MTENQKKEFTRKITQSNSTELIIVLYDMAITYLDDAIKVFGDDKNFAIEVNRAKSCIEEMIANLHFEVELSKNFHQIYLSMKKTLREAISENNKEQILSVRNNLLSLKNAYEKIVSEDQTAPVMAHTQSVVAGLTYGKTDINESLAGDSGKRGFLV